MLFHIDNNLIFNFSPSNISSSSLSLKSLYSLDFCLIAFLNRPELELALPGEPAAMLEFCFGVFLGLYARASLSPMNQGTVHRNTKQQQAAHVFFLSPCSPLKQKKEKKKNAWSQVTRIVACSPPARFERLRSPGGTGTLGISGWGCAAGTLDPFTYTKASSAEFCYPILE